MKVAILAIRSLLHRGELIPAGQVVKMDLRDAADALGSGRARLVTPGDQQLVDDDQRKTVERLTRHDRFPAPPPGPWTRTH